MFRKTKTIAFNLIVLLGVVSSFLFSPTRAQAGYAEREKQLSIMLSSAVEFRWDSDKRTRQAHESLGTKISPNTVLTHNHFSDLAGTHIVDPSNLKRPHNVTNTTRTTSFGRSRQYGAQTRLVFSTVKYAGDIAPIASKRTIKQLCVGEAVDVVYWDDARKTLAVTVFQIKAIRQGAVIVLDDPADIINGGDSGGGVFYHGELIGNTWRYIESLDRQGNSVDKEVHVQIVPPELSQALRNW
jgi:hypothetical protein